MKSLRGWSSVVLFAPCFLAAACSAPADTGDAASDMVTAVDVRDVAVARDTGPDRPLPADPCASDALVDLTTVTPNSSGVVRYMGDSTFTRDVAGPSAPMGCISYMPDTHHAGHEVILKYRMRTTAGLIATTDNTGTAAEFDTVLFILNACTSTANSLGCNDDMNGNTVHSLVTSDGELAAGTDVYVVVSGYSPPANNMYLDSGPFEITLREVPATAANGACTPGMSVCATGTHCLVSFTDPMMAVCMTDGTAGALCRNTATRCDTGLTCSAAAATDAGICRSVVTPPAACDPTGRVSVCMTPALCERITGTAASCTTTTVNEVEPNDTSANAQAAVSVTTVYSAGFMTGIDQDCFAVTVAAGQSLVIETNDGQGGCPADTLVKLYAPAVADAGAPAVLVQDDDGGPGLCSYIDGTVTTSPAHALAAGTYMICVAQAGTMPGAVPQYYTSVTIAP